MVGGLEYLSSRLEGWSTCSHGWGTCSHGWSTCLHGWRVGAPVLVVGGLEHLSSWLEGWNICPHRGPMLISQYLSDGPELSITTFPGESSGLHCHQVYMGHTYMHAGGMHTQKHKVIFKKTDNTAELQGRVQIPRIANTPIQAVLSCLP